MKIKILNFLNQCQEDYDYDMVINYWENTATDRDTDFIITYKDYEGNLCYIRYESQYGNLYFGDTQITFEGLQQLITGE